MTKVLITAFEPYDVWSENASWLAMVHLTGDLPKNVSVVSRRYPVDFEEVKNRLESDLTADYDVVIHMGQAPGAAHLRLEAIGINVGGDLGQMPEEFGVLAPDGPVAYRSALPLPDWAAMLRQADIDAHVSYHAGEYLCNATLYWTHFLAEKHGLKTQAMFLHLPLAPSQATGDHRDVPSLEPEKVARAVRLILMTM